MIVLKARGPVASRVVALGLLATLLMADTDTGANNLQNFPVITSVIEVPVAGDTFSPAR